MSFDVLAALSRRHLLGGAGALAFLPAAGTRAADSTPSAVPVSAASGADGGSPALKTQLVLEIRADVGAPVQMGQGALGLRRLIPITGGTFSGPRLSGVVVPGGADWQIERPDGMTALESTYTLKASDGTLVSVTSRGILGPAAPGSLHDSCVRTVPEFEVPAGAHDWLCRAVLVGSLDASPFSQGHVLLRIFRVA